VAAPDFAQREPDLKNYNRIGPEWYRRYLLRALQKKLATRQNSRRATLAEDGPLRGPSIALCSDVHTQTHYPMNGLSISNSELLSV
jgi:hypothetical protein